ncbi:hypothetical protein SESBI_37112 [Sesbania bispinosa]|nr:hypothetical protein SESBI_37112 [Sesbania bispinosa]
MDSLDMLGHAQLHQLMLLSQNPIKPETPAPISARALIVLLPVEPAPSFFVTTDDIE